MKPLILDFKLTRHETESSVIYKYDTLQSLSVVEINGKKIPFIQLEHIDLETMTKTKVYRENDDDTFLFELGTKTEVKREGDDPLDTFLELTTKTFVIRERDDNDSFNN